MANYLLFDTETTGNQQEDRIIQVGGMLVGQEGKFEIFDELCSCDVAIKIEAMEVHNITPEMIANKPSFRETMFFQALEAHNNRQNYLIAHNIKFDLAMIQKEQFSSQYTLVDTLRCAKHLLEEQESYRLQYLRYKLGLYHNEAQEAQKLGITIKAHDAIGDVLVMKLLLSHLVTLARQKEPQKNPMVYLAELTQRPALMRRFPFGKYKGEEIASKINDSGYIKWILGLDELDEELRYSIEYYLKQEN